jgi:hypothetical protein
VVVGLTDLHVAPFATEKFWGQENRTGVTLFLIFLSFIFLSPSKLGLESIRFDSAIESISSAAKPAAGSRLPAMAGRSDSCRNPLSDKELWTVSRRAARRLARLLLLVRSVRPKSNLPGGRPTF